MPGMQLVPEAEELLRLFGSTYVMTKDLREKHRNLWSGYGRLLKIFLFVNQDAFSVLSAESKDDIIATLVRVYESIYWAQRSVGAPENPGYSDVSWLLLCDKEDGMITESYKLVTQKIIRNCVPNVFLEQALLRLMHSYTIGNEVTNICQSIIRARQHGGGGDLKKKRVGKSFILQADSTGRLSDKPINMPRDQEPPYNRRVIGGRSKN